VRWSHGPIGGFVEDLFAFLMSPLDRGVFVAFASALLLGHNSSLQKKTYFLASFSKNAK
jgi:hypothetical protein